MEEKITVHRAETTDLKTDLNLKSIYLCKYDVVSRTHKIETPEQIMSSRDVHDLALKIYEAENVVDRGPITYAICIDIAQEVVGIHEVFLDSPKGLNKFKEVKNIGLTPREVVTRALINDASGVILISFQYDALELNEVEKDYLKTLKTMCSTMHILLLDYIMISKHSLTHYKSASAEKMFNFNIHKA